MNRGPLVAILTMAALASTGALGCGVRTTMVSLDASWSSRAARPASSVEVFHTQRPSQPYREMAILRVEEESVYANVDETTVWSRLREDAGRIGCDALIVMGRSGTVASDLGGRYSRTLKGWEAVCVVYDIPLGLPKPSAP